SIASIDSDEFFSSFIVNFNQPTAMVIPTFKFNRTFAILSQLDQEYSWFSCESILTVGSLNALVDGYEAKFAAALDFSFFDGPYCRWKSPFELIISTVNSGYEFAIHSGDVLELYPDAVKSASVGVPACTLEPCFGPIGGSVLSGFVG